MRLPHHDLLGTPGLFSGDMCAYCPPCPCPFIIASTDPPVPSPHFPQLLISGRTRSSTEARRWTCCTRRSSRCGEGSVESVDFM